MITTTNWERVELGARTPCYASRTDYHFVKVLKTQKNKGYDKLSINTQLAKELGWKPGDSIWLYRSSNPDEFMIKKEKSDYVLRKSGNGVCLNSVIFCAYLAFYDKIPHFNATIEDDTLFLSRAANE